MEQYIKSISKVVCLKGILTEEDLDDDDLFEKVYTDIRTEMSKFGPIKSLVIPRPHEVTSS